VLAILYMRQSGSSLESFTVLQPEDLQRFGNLLARVLPVSRAAAVVK
jgi:hypothetical protein